MGIEINEVSRNAKGGTELMMARLAELPAELLDSVQIIFSRVRELDESKHRILYVHDLAEDPENEHLKNNGWSRFHKIVFVSHTQRQQFISRFKIPYSMTSVLQNAITPIPEHEKPKDDITRIIYHTTPHRGLELLFPVFEKLSEDIPNIHLDVYSSFSIYGWPERDKPYQEFFDRLKKHEKCTYHGSVSNEEIRTALSKSHIFAYPSIWEETSCLALMEAMSAGCICVHPSFGALPETAANWTIMYEFDEDVSRHASKFYHVLKHIIPMVGSEQMENQLIGQKTYANIFYNWDVRKHQWTQLISDVTSKPLTNFSSSDFSYNTSK